MTMLAMDLLDDGAPEGDEAVTEMHQIAPALIEAAVLAPSRYNTQPWLFRSWPDSLELVADRSRVLPASDPAARELVMSCGAALMNVRIALRHFGFAGVVETFPSPANPDLLARISLGKRHQPTHQDHALFAAISRRHTQRADYDKRPLPAAVVEQLGGAVRSEGVDLQVIEGKTQRGVLAELVAAGDRIQSARPEYREELSAWLAPNDAGARQGMPGYVFGLSQTASRLAPVITRMLPWPLSPAYRGRSRALRAPVLAVISTGGDTPRDWLAAGQALQRMLLTATVRGVSASFINQPCQVPALREQLRRMLGLFGVPQLALRMGYARRSRLRTLRRLGKEIMD
ncbi:MAG TPA: nitroreductase family protein [Gemmatimonadaceae bacterium]|nr:nitroreductase family protein [Gemmatimonadaceae bacterium]